MSDINESKKLSGECGATAATVETIVDGIGAISIETKNEIDVVTTVESAETIITVDEPTKSAKPDSVHTEDVKRTEPSTTTTEPTMTKKLNGPSIPKGKYALVSVDVDTTGRRLIDEVNSQYYYLLSCS